MTSRQQEILEFIKEARVRTGLPPSTREMQAHFGFRSQNSVMRQLRALVALGHLEKPRGMARGWVPTSPERTAGQVLRVPLFGTIPAGSPDSSGEEDVEFLHLDSELLQIPKGKRLFALRVRGESMIGAHILPGDLVILEFRSPKHGDVVAALIDGETTLKRFLIKGNLPFLRAENPEFPDLIPARELVVQGVLVCLLRREFSKKPASGLSRKKVDPEG